MSFHCYYKCWRCKSEVWPPFNKPEVPDGWLEIKRGTQPAYAAQHFCSTECLLESEMEMIEVTHQHERDFA